MPEKNSVPAGRGREIIESLQQGLKDDEVNVLITKLCERFGVTRRTDYYRPMKKVPVVQERFAKPIKEMNEETPSFGYRTVAVLLGFNKNTVQRIFQLKCWQCKKLPVGFQPSIQAMPSVANEPDERWSTDLCRVWACRDGWAGSRYGLPYPGTLGLASLKIGPRQNRRSRLGTSAHQPVRHAWKVKAPFLLRSDNGLVFTSRSYKALVKSYGLQQEFITPHCPQQNGMVERLIRTIKEQCVHRYRFEMIQHASRVIGDWDTFYNHLRPHQAFGMKTPAATFNNYPTFGGSLHDFMF